MPVPPDSDNGHTHIKDKHVAAESDKTSVGTSGEKGCHESSCRSDQCQLHPVETEGGQCHDGGDGYQNRKGYP